MESNCLFGTYRASAARSFFLSGASRYSATIRIDNLLCPNFIKAPNVRLSLGDEDEYVGKRFPLGPRLGSNAVTSYARSPYTDTAISLSTLGQLVLFHIANLTSFENLDVAQWRRLENRTQPFELTEPPKSDGRKRNLKSIWIGLARNHVR